MTKAWGYHFRLSRWIWWFLAIALGIATVFVPTAELRIAAVVLALSSLAGGIRWWSARRRCSGALLVPRFFEAGDARHAEEAQRIIVETLQAHLPIELRDTVQPLSVSIGGDEQAFAEKTRKRLRGIFILHGRISGRDDGGWSVFPRILEPAYDSTTHLDWFTRDRTPANPRFGPFVSNLAPQRGVLDEEFPFDFCRDLEALMRGITGRVALVFGAYQQALDLLDAALAVASEGTNAQIDALRLARARALDGLEREQEAIATLRRRAQGEEPSPELLRGLAHLLLLNANREAERGREPDPNLRDEAIAVLRSARAVETDPQRDQSTYNLFALLDFDASESERTESEELLEALLRSPSGYGRQWYVRRAAGVRAWRRVESAILIGDTEAISEAGKEAGRWYAQAIRARPRFQLRRQGRWRVSPHVIPQSPILFANAKDGYHYGGNRLRSRWYEWCFQRLRSRFMKRGWKAIKAQQWGLAYSYYDWVSIVGRGDEKEAWAHTYAAVCLWKQGQREQAGQAWAQARRRGPVALLARANLAWFFDQWGIDASVPGDEPTNQEDVEREVQRLLNRPPGIL